MYSENERFNDEYEENESINSSSGNKFKDFYESNKKMVLILGGLLLVFLFLMMLNSCSKNNDTTPTEIKVLIEPAENYVNLDNSIKLTASIEPKGADANPRFSWKSSNDSIASVDMLGNVTGVSLGKVTITVIYTDSKNKEYTGEVLVNVVEGNRDVKATKVEFPNDEVLISSGDSYKLPKNVTPGNAYIENLTYTSDNTSILEVGNDGIIKALKKGIATVKMIANNGQFEDEIVVNVVEERVDPQIIINPTKFVFNNNELSLAEGDEKKLTYQVVPTSSYVDDIEWSSSDEDIAIVDNEGNLEAISEGIAVITIKNRKGLEEKMSVKVEKGIVKVTSLEIISDKDLEMDINETSKIVVNVLPNDATDKIVTYESSDQRVASVTNDGTIRALSAGSAVITVTTNDGGLKEFIMVKVNKSSSSSSGNSSGSSKVCTSDLLIRIDSNSGNAITTQKGGNDNTATKNKITIETDLIGTQTSCADISSLKWCSKKYDGSPCTPNESFDVGDDLTMNVPNGKDVMYLKFEAILTDGDVHTKEYYMKYDVSGGSSSNNTSNPPTTSSELSDIVINSKKINNGKILINKNETAQINVIAQYKNGNSDNVTSSAEFTIFDQSIVSITSDGKITGLDDGNTTIKVSYEGKIKNIDVEVSIPKLKLSMINIEKVHMGLWDKGPVYTFDLKVDSNYKISRVYACMGGQAYECEPNFTSSERANVNPNASTTEYELYSEKTVFYDVSSPSSIAAVRWKSWTDHHMCFAVLTDDGIKSEKTCYKFIK